MAPSLHDSLPFCDARMQNFRVLFSMDPGGGGVRTPGPSRGTGRRQATRARSTLTTASHWPGRRTRKQSSRWAGGRALLPGGSPSFLCLSGLISASIWVITLYSASFLAFIQGGEETHQNLSRGRKFFQTLHSCSLHGWGEDGSSKVP